MFVGREWYLMNIVTEQFVFFFVRVANKFQCQNIEENKKLFHRFVGASFETVLQVFKLATQFQIINLERVQLGILCNVYQH